MPNPWDAGSAKLLASLGFAALATTSSGFAGTLGRLDGHVTRDEALAHARACSSAAVDVPVSADLENGFGDSAGRGRRDDPPRHRHRPGGRVDRGLLGPRAGRDLRPRAGHRPGARPPPRPPTPARSRFVLTARAENLIRGRADLPDTIARLQAYQEAGRRRAVRPGPPRHRRHRDGRARGRPPGERAGRPGRPDRAASWRRRAWRGSRSVARSATSAVAAVAAAARELLEEGTLGYGDQVKDGRRAGAGAPTADAASAGRARGRRPSPRGRGRRRPSVRHSWLVATTSRMRSVSGSTSRSAPSPRLVRPSTQNVVSVSSKVISIGAPGAGADQGGAELVDGHPHLLDGGQVELAEGRHAAGHQPQHPQQPRVGREHELQRGAVGGRPSLSRPRGGRRRPRRARAAR